MEDRGMAPSGHGARQLVETRETAQLAGVPQTGPEASLLFLRPGPSLAPPMSDIVEERLQAIEAHASTLARTVATTRAMLALVEQRLQELREVEARVATLRADLDARERPVRKRRAKEPCPLSSRELEVLMALADGKVYKQIAREMSLSVSTVRSHLHRSYTKMGVPDRAQAVLLATKRGWI
jgi:DNA-binding NarL/FixJ family response regulator